jgi:Protein of unknown function (DUF1580)
MARTKKASTFALAEKNVSDPTTANEAPKTNPLLLEAKLLLSVLAKEVPSNRVGGSVTVSALWRWISQGVQGPDGRIIRLEALRIGGRYYSSIPALHRFILAQQDAPPSEPPAPARTPTKRKRSSRGRDEVLEAAGV